MDRSTLLSMLQKLNSKLIPMHFLDSLNKLELLLPWYEKDANSLVLMLLGYVGPARFLLTEDPTPL